MKKSVIVMIALAISLTASTAYAWAGDQQPPATTTSASTAGANVNLAPMNPTANANGGNSLAKASGSANMTGSGNGGGAQVNDPTTVRTTSTTSNALMDFNPVQVAPLPPSMMLGSIRLDAVTSCGPQADIKPFDRAFYKSEFLGLWSKRVPVGTMHGIFKGWRTGKDAFTIVKAEIGEPFNRVIYKVMGMQLYSVTETVSESSGTSSAGNGLVEKAVTGGIAGGGGVSQASSTALNDVGVVAMPCEYEIEDNSKPKVAETPPEVTKKDITDINRKMDDLDQKITNLGRTVLQHGGEK